METHLRSREYYEDRYDRITVDSCRRSEKFFLEGHKKEKNKKEAEKMAAVYEYVWRIKKIFLTKHWYDDKEPTIQKWMQDDAKRDEMLEQSEVPKNILCDECYDRMNEDGKIIYERDGTDEVLFFMRCPNGHLPMKGVFEDGTVRKSEPILCPECSSEMNVKRIPKKGKGVKTKYTCTKCDYSEIDDWTPKEEAIDPDYNKDRARFCLEGETLRYVQDCIYQMEQMKSLVDEWNHRKEHKEEYDAVANITKLTIPQVKELLTGVLDDKIYTNLIFEKPEIQRFVSMEFSLEELETDNQKASTNKVRKIVREALDKTNWRLMSGGIDYRLGLMTGRIRAYESEEDLLKLVK